MMQFVASRSREATLKFRLRPAELFSISGFKSPVQYFCSATSTATYAGSGLMVGYLVNTVGLSRDEAISASPKVSHLKSTENSDLILNLFKTYGGLDQTHIRNLVSAVPQLLLHRADETLELKFRAYKDLGLSGFNLVNVIKRDRELYKRGLDSRIIPTLSYLRDLLGNDENVLKAINKCCWLLRYHKLCNNLQPNVLLLESYGVPNDRIAKLVMQYPYTFLQKPEWLRNVVTRAERELGIASNFRKFCTGIVAISKASDSTLNKKRDVFRSFGWSDSDISTLFRRCPTCINLSEAKIHNTLNFTMKELGYAPAYLAIRPLHFTLSLETRVKPRYELVKLLEGMMHVKINTSFYSLFCYTEFQFVKFLWLYKDKVPNLLGIYQSRMRSKSKHRWGASISTSAENIP